MFVRAYRAFCVCSCSSGDKHYLLTSWLSCPYTKPRKCASTLQGLVTPKMALWGAHKVQVKALCVKLCLRNYACDFRGAIWEEREKYMLLPKTENTKIIWCESTAEPTPTLLMVRPRICCCSTSIFRMCPHGAYAGPLRLVSYRNHVAAFIIHRQFVRKPAKATAFGIWRMQNASQGWQAPTIRSYCAVIGNTVISRANY